MSNLDMASFLLGTWIVPALAFAWKAYRAWSGEREERRWNADSQLRRSILILERMEARLEKMEDASEPR